MSIIEQELTVGQRVRYTNGVDTVEGEIVSIGNWMVGLKVSKHSRTDLNIKKSWVNKRRVTFEILDATADSALETLV